MNQRNRERNGVTADRLLQARDFESTSQPCSSAYQPGRGRSCFSKKSELCERISPGAVNRPIIQSAPQSQRHVQLGVLHIHSMVNFDIIAIDETRRSLES